MLCRWAYVASVRAYLQRVRACACACMCERNQKKQTCFDVCKSVSFCDVLFVFQIILSRRYFVLCRSAYVSLSLKKLQFHVLSEHLENVRFAIMCALVRAVCVLACDCAHVRGTCVVCACV